MRGPGAPRMAPARPEMQKSGTRALGNEIQGDFRMKNWGSGRVLPLSHKRPPLILCAIRTSDGSGVGSSSSSSKASISIEPTLDEVDNCHFFEQVIDVGFLMKSVSVNAAFYGHPQIGK